MSGYANSGSWMNRLLKVVRWTCAGLTLIVFLGQLVMVLMRYLLGAGFLEVQDTVNYAFAVLVALSVVVTFGADRHVRVDVYRQRWTSRANRRIDLTGDLLLAVPVFAILLWTAYPLIQSSWKILEGSPETGGLPGLFLVKTFLLVLPTLVLLLVLKRLVDRLRRSPE